MKNHRRKQSYFVPSKTQTLTVDNYDSLVTHGDQVWIIQVWREYNCERCIQFSDAWEEAARQMSGVVNFGRINFDRQSALRETYTQPTMTTIIYIYIEPRNFAIRTELTVPRMRRSASVPDQVTAHILCSYQQSTRCQIL